jgi:hypothetical protein
MSRPDTFRQRLQALAHAFHVPGDAVDLWSVTVAGQGTGGCRPTNLSSLQAAAILRVAAVHQAECIAVACATCEEIAEVLAILLAAQRLSDIDQFRLITKTLS